MVGDYSPSSAPRKRRASALPSARVFLRYIEPFEQFAEQHHAETGFDGQNDGGRQRGKGHGGGITDHEFQQKKDADERGGRRHQRQRQDEQLSECKNQPLAGG